VNILSIDQKPISELFASSSLDKFSKQSWSSGIKSLPLLNNCACQLLCSTEHRYPGGDHMILVGRVIQTKNNGSSPLIYHGGKYKQLK